MCTYSRIWYLITIVDQFNWNITLKDHNLIYAVMVEGLKSLLLIDIVLGVSLTVRHLGQVLWWFTHFISNMFIGELIFLLNYKFIEIVFISVLKKLSLKHTCFFITSNFPNGRICSQQFRLTKCLSGLQCQHFLQLWMITPVINRDCKVVYVAI